MKIIGKTNKSEIANAIQKYNGTEIKRERNRSSQYCGRQA